jgi:4-hydroxybenzoate polyprenyltransferase
VLAVGAFAVLWPGGPPPAGRLALLLLMVALQQAAISLHNDWCDRSLDAVAKPWRALPSGRVAPGTVAAAAYVLAALSAASAWPLGHDLVALDLAGLAAGFAYNARLKRTPLSWLPFALAFPLLPLFAAAALDRWPPAWPTLFAVGLPVVVAIHLADALPDLDADAAAGARGLAPWLGPRRAQRLSLFALAAAALIALSAGLALAWGGGWGLGPAAAVAGGALGWLGLGAAVAKPGTHRLSVTAGAAAIALGWVGLVARTGG